MATKQSRVRGEPAVAGLLPPGLDPGVVMTSRFEPALFVVDPIPGDLDADAAFDNVELLDPDAHPAHPWMLENDLGDVLDDRLDEIDMAPPRHQADRVQDDIVGEDGMHVVGARRGALNRSLDIEHDALWRTMFALVCAEVGGSEKVANEDNIAFSFVQPSRTLAW